MIRRLAVFVCELAVLALVVRVSLKGANSSDPKSRDPDWRIFGLWIAASIFLSPLAWNHYMVVLFIPFVQILAAATMGETGSRPILAAAACYMLGNLATVTFLRLVTAPPDWIEHHRLLFVTLQEVGFAGMLAGFMAAYWFATDRTLAGASADSSPLSSSGEFPPLAHRA